MYRFYSNPTQGNRVSVVGVLENGKLDVAVARTGKNEMFIRKKGRAIAEGRLKKKRLFTTIAVNKETLTSEEFIVIAQEIAKEVINTKKVVQ